MLTIVRLLALEAPGGEISETPAGEEAEIPGVPGAQQFDSFAEWLAGQIDSEVLSHIVETLLAPALQILLVLLLASLVLILGRRVIHRVVGRAKEAPTYRARRLLRRGGPAEPEPDAEKPAYSVRRAQRADALGALTSSILTAAVWFIGGMMILAAVGLDLAPVIVGAGVLGLAIGFGAQDVVKDLLSGVFMLAEDQFGVGDIIDAGEAAGVVEGVSLRSTRVRDVHGTLWHIPNGEIRRVGNKSQQWARSLLDIGVSYQTDVDLAIDLIQRVADTMAHEDEYRDLFLDEPEVWGVESLGSDSVDIRLVIKTEPAKQWAISRELRRRIKATFDAAGIEIPFPQRTVWLRTDEPLAYAKVDGPPPQRADGPPAESEVAAAVAHGAEGDRGAKAVEGQDHEAVIEDEGLDSDR
jgi:moderate conductance mechanosensitive channel